MPATPKSKDYAKLINDAINEIIHTATMEPSDQMDAIAMAVAGNILSHTKAGGEPIIFSIFMEKLIRFYAEMIHPQPRVKPSDAPEGENDGKEG